MKKYTRLNWFVHGNHPLTIKGLSIAEVALQADMTDVGYIGRPKVSLSPMVVTSSQVALQADMTDVGYLYLEQGKRTPLVTTAIRVANALGITDYRALWLQK